MAAVDERPHPPGAYDVVVVGSGPGGLQTSYCLSRLGVRHAVLSADSAPGGMFRKWPIFERLISWTKVNAPVERGTREYEWYDHNSLVAEEREHRALVPAAMRGGFIFPTRQEMEAGLAAFAERAGVRVRYGCRWESTRRHERGFTLATSDGEYECRAAVFALGVTEPWKSAVPGVEQVPHYAETGAASDYRDKRVLVIGKRNSGFEIADGLLPWARSIVLVSPRPAHTAVLARATVRVRYLQPLEDHAFGAGTHVLDAAIERIERTEGDGFRVVVSGTAQPGTLELEADAVIAATGFRTPLRDLPGLGLATVAEGRIPALTPFWESISVPGLYFAGNASQGAAGLRKHGSAGGSSTSVHGFRYNAGILARHLAQRVAGVPPAPRAVANDAVAPLLGGALRFAPELWAQKAYLARVVTVERNRAEDWGVQPLAHFVDEPAPDGIAVTVEADETGTIFPAVYVRHGGAVREERLEADPVNAFDASRYRTQLDALLADFGL